VGLASGDVFVLHTDGLTDARRAGEDYGDAPADHATLIVVKVR